MSLANFLSFKNVFFFSLKFFCQSCCKEAPVKNVPKLVNHLLYFYLFPLISSSNYFASFDMENSIFFTSYWILRNI